MKLTAVILLFGTNTVALAQIAPRPEGHFVTLNGARVYYETYGPSGSPSLVLLHRFGSTAEEWQPLIQSFSTNRYVIAWDMRGHGRSSDPDTSLDFRHQQAARDLLALLDSLKLRRVQAIGGSSGGITLLYAAYLAPERFEAIVPVGLQLYYAPSTRNWISRAGPDSADPTAMAASTRLHGPARAMKLARTFWAFRTFYGDPELTPDRLARITARVLIVHGDDDPIAPVSEAWDAYKAMPNARLWIVPHGGHLPYGAAANRDDFVRRVTEFLDGKWEPH